MTETAKNLTPQTKQAEVVALALNDFNSDTGKAWTFGANWNNQGSTFETFVNKYLFPKLNETLIIDQVLGNRFNPWAEETDFIGQYSEEMVVLDSVPIEMNLSKNAELMLKRNYPNIATKLYGAGILKKVKFTLNNNDTRLNFRTIGDATKYALAVYNKKISDINVAEEKEIKAMIVDYAVKNIKDKRTASETGIEGLIKEINVAILNLQNNSSDHNEASLASGGTVSTYTTVSSLDDLLIITTDKVKARILDSVIATNFHNAGIDITDHIISFDTLKGAFRWTSDYTIPNTSVGKALVAGMQARGDYQVAVGDVIPKGTVMLYSPNHIPNVSGITEIEEIKPTTDGKEVAIILDKRALRYKRYTKGMLKEPFYNGEFDEVTYWIHYYSFKAISPFYNKILLTEK